MEDFIVSKIKSQQECVNKIQNLCRLCLMQSGELDLSSSSYLPNMKWIDILLNVILDEQIKVHKDEYPQGICEECSSKLVLFFKFKQKVKLSYETLNHILNNVQSSEISTNCNDDTFTYGSEDAITNDIDEDLRRNEEDMDNNSSSVEVYKIIHEIGDESEANQESVEVEKLNDINEDLVQIRKNDFADEIIEVDVGFVEEDNDNDNSEIDYQCFYTEDSSNTETKSHIKDNLNDTVITESYKIDKSNKNIECELCGMKFTRKSSLKQHSTVHSEKKFKCDLCDKRFTRSPHLDIHMLIHSKIRPHSCKECGKAFTKSGDLKRHEKIHSDTYDYICSMCSKKFKRKEYLVAHIDSHHRIKRFKCSVCNKSYQSLSGLHKHKKNVH